MICIVDKNKELIKEVKRLLKVMPYKNVTAKVGDIFKQKGVIVSASNPDFTFGGGLDAGIAKVYPKECAKAQKKKGKNQRIGNVIFTVTVDKDLKSNRELVLTAIKFAISKIKSNETLLISGLGTGIGGLTIDEYISALMEALNDLHGYRWKFLTKGLRSDRGDCKWTVGRWKIHRGKLEMCESGFHCSRQIHQAFSYVYEERLALVEVSGKHLKEDDKEAWSKMRPVRVWNWNKGASVELAVYAAELVIDIFEKVYPNDKRPRMAIEAAKKWLKTPTEAAGDAAGDAARAARAAGDAAWAARAAGDAWAARAAGDTARDAAWAAWAAGDTARAAAWAARDAAWAAGDAAWAARAAGDAWAAGDAAWAAGDAAWAARAAGDTAWAAAWAARDAAWAAGDAAGAARAAGDAAWAARAAGDAGDAVTQKIGIWMGQKLFGLRSVKS